MIINEIIIIGGGNSIKEGISLGLKDRIKDKFVIACNYAGVPLKDNNHYFENTFLCCIDDEFYKSTDLKEHPNIYEELKNLPLIICAEKNKFYEIKFPNTILLKKDKEYHRENSLIKGFYLPVILTGIFALSLASYLINFNGTIYLLGYDWSKRIINNPTPVETHYYSKNEINHKGQLHTNWYEKHNPDKYFKTFLNESNLKIYNVIGTPISNIDSFEKIDYLTMFQTLSNVRYNQEELRTYIRRKLCI